MSESGAGSSRVRFGWLMTHSPVSRPDRPDGKGYVMRKSSKSKALTPAWPDERFKSETPASETFTAYGERPFDPVWGIEHWGSEIHGRRGPQPFHVPVLDENGNPVFGKDSKPLFKPDEEHDVVILTGTGPGRGTRHIEANAPDWRLPVGLTLSRPFSDAGEALLRDMGVAKRYNDAFEPLPGVLRAVLLTTCHVAMEMLPNLTGSQVETILRQHAGALGVASETPAGALPVNEGQMSGEARALAILTDHPDWTDKRIAEEAGVHVKTLHRYARFRTARRMVRDSGRADLPRGFKTEDGDIEAYE